MISIGRERFREVWLADFEFIAGTGDRPVPICLVAREVRLSASTGCGGRISRDGSPRPYSTAVDCLFVSYYASAELGCHLALGWPLPVRVLDLLCRVSALTNGRPTPCGNGPCSARSRSSGSTPSTSPRRTPCGSLSFGRAVVIRGAGGRSSTTVTRTSAALNACARHAARLDFPRALLRGRYMAAAARIEHCRRPRSIRQALERLRASWPTIQDRLIARSTRLRRVRRADFQGRTAWRSGSHAQGIPWPRLPSGRLALDDDTFRDMARCVSRQSPRLRELRVSLAQLRLRRSGRGRRRPQPLSAVSVSCADRPEPAQQCRFIFGPRSGSGAYSTQPGHGAGLRRLVAAGVRHRRGPVGRPGMREAYVGRPVPRLRQAGGCRSRRRHEASPTGRYGAVQSVRAGGAVRHGPRRWRSGPVSAGRKPGSYCACIG